MRVDEVASWLQIAHDEFLVIGRVKNNDSDWGFFPNVDAHGNLLHPWSSLKFLN